MPESIALKALIPATPAVVYAAWLDGKIHGDMTGGDATCEARVGGQFSAWDGYIEGVNIELVEGTRIVQEWRSSEFPPGAPHSLLEITLRAASGGTELSLTHSNIPDGQGPQYARGWAEHYFAPMKEYFSSRVGKAKRAPAKKAAKRRPAPKAARRRAR
jgi:uncharacterized protein YndB with AHSA1/START domain